MTASTTKVPTTWMDDQVRLTMIRRQWFGIEGSLTKTIEEYRRRSFNATDLGDREELSARAVYYARLRDELRAAIGPDIVDWDL